MAEEEVLMEVIVNESDEVQFYSAADQCKILCEDNDAMVRTIKEAVKEGLLVLPSIKWNEIQSVRFTSKTEKSVEISSEEALHETEYVPYEIVEETPVDEAVMSSEVPEEIIIDVGLSSGKELRCELASANEVLEGINFIDERLNLCPYCDYRTYNVGHFKVHMRQHTGEAPFACEYCPYRSKQKSNLKRHLKQHLEGKDNFECEMCSFTCTKEKVYKRHLKLHQRSRPLRPCPFCDYFSSSLAHLTVHIRQHTGETPYHCGVCQYKTVQKSNLTRHLKKHRHHRVSKADKLRLCDHCNYRTPNSAHLLAHIRAAHTGEAPYSCKHCDYKSAQRSNLKRHMRKHTGERPFTCHLCDYSTAYAYVLKKHIDNHSDQDEKFKCDSCDYFTNSSLDFKRHLKIHSGRSMYCCHFCGYITLNGDHFKVHLRRHTKEAPFKCHHCNYSTAQRSNLKRHIQTHTEKNKEYREMASYNETRNAMEPEIEMSEGEAENDKSRVLNKNVPVIDTTQHQTGNVQIYPSQETYVEAPYSPTEGDLHEETVVATVNETSMEIVSEEHVVTSQYDGEEYEVYDDSGKLYLCSYCSYQSSSTEEIEGHMQEHEGKLYFKCQFCDYRSGTKSNVSRHMQKHLGALVNGVDNAVETDNPESDIAKANISFLNKSQTEKLKEFKRLLQEGTTSNSQNMAQAKFPEHNITTETINHYPGLRNSVHSAEEYRVAESLQNGLNILNNEAAVYRNQPSPEEVTLYGEIAEANFQEGIIEEEVISKDSSVLIVGTSKELESRHDCELCGFHARTIWELKSHIRVHTGEMSYVCPQCPFKTNQKNSFYRHVRHLHARRGNRIPYQCKLCEFKVKNREIFNKHLLTHSKKTAPSIECEICEQVMGSLAELKGHMKVHIGEAPYECFYCGKLTARKLHLRRHMKRHICTLEGKGPPFECDSCGYQTVYKTNYLRHLETHELDPPKALICHYCRFVTLDSKVFKQHLIEHRNPDRLEMLKDKLSQCPICDYNTYNHGHFLVHLRQHTGIAPYSCHLCPYRSAQRSNLKRHTKFKHNRLGELDDLLILDGMESNDNSQNNAMPEISNRRRKPLREQNTPFQNGKSNKSNIVKHLLKLDKDSNSTKLKNQIILNTSSTKANKSVKKREYIRRLGNVSESELRIRRRLDFNIKKVPKEPKAGFNVELRGEILKSKRQLREFNDFGKIIKRSDLDLSTVIEKESNIEAMFAPLRESIQALKELKNSGENVVTFTIYFKTKDERDTTNIDNITDIEAELLTDSNESDSDSIKIDDELSSTIMSDNDKNGTTKEIKSPKKELSYSENGISPLNQIPIKKNFPLSFSIDRIKFFQNKIKERNEKMKQIRRQKVLRNSYALNKNSAKTDSSSSKKCVQVEYSYDNVEIEEVVIDHSIDALPSLV